MKALFFILVAFLLSSAAAISQTEKIEVQGSVIINSALSVTPPNISTNVLSFSFLERNLTFRQNTNFDFNVSLQSAGAVADWLSFSAFNFTIAPSGQRNVTVFVSVPETAPGVYKGNITANSIKIPVTLTVTDKYGLQSSVDAQPSSIVAGQNITITATITKALLGKINETEGTIPVVSTYIITKGTTVILQFNKTSNVQDFVTESFNVKIPNNATSGKYKVTLSAQHLDKKTVSSASFFVGKNSALGRILASLFSIFG